MSYVVVDAACEAPIAGEDYSWDPELVNDIAGPAMEHVDNNAIRGALDEELPKRFEEGRGVDEGTGRHVCVGYVGGEGVNGDGKTGLLVALD